MLQHISIITIIILTAFFSFSEVNAELTVFDDDYIIEEFVSGLDFPTTIDFIGNDLLILERNTGEVIRINENGEMYEEPVLVVPVSAGWETGLLGIITTSDHVYLYFTESRLGYENPKNTVYQYDWDGKNLINPILITEFPADSGIHSGGVFTKDQNEKIYFVIGDNNQDTVFQNIPTESIIESGSIFKMHTDENNRIELFAMGIRNSFGLGVDPITGYLWETENGEQSFDEINLVNYGLNSGWKSIMGPSYRDNNDSTVFQRTPQSFKNFIYSDPEFSWHHAIGVTAIAFPDMMNFGKYSDWLFVGDFNNGRIYKFQLNTDRTEFIFSTPNLKDLVYDNNDELNEILFAETFPGGVTDIKFGHDGMYVVSPFYNGTIYKIYPKQPIPPLQQYQIGISHKEIDCKSGLMPIMRNSVWINCVYPKTASTLINEIGWSITHTEMPKINFKYQYLNGLNFEYLNLKNSDFKGAIFDTAKITNVNFTNTNLSNSNLVDKDLTGTILIDANLTNANLTNVDLSGKDLTGTILRGVDLTNANITNVSLSGKDLTNANLTNVDLSGKDLTGIVIKGVDLSGKDLTNTILKDVDLSNKDLTDTILKGVDLTDRDLRNSNFTRSDLTNSNLSGANLSTSIFTDAILTDANLENVNTNNTILDCFDHEICK